MDLFEHLAHARQAAKTKAAANRTTQVFRMDWRSAGCEFVVGYKAICQRLGIKETSLRTRLSTTKNRYSLRRVNPVHGEYDIVTVSKVSTAKIPKKQRGRVAKQIDWSRLGSEAPGFPSGTDLTESAKTMPKDANRDTDEKQ